jgi:hypothetical protein
MARVRAAVVLPPVVAAVVALVAWWAGGPYVVGVFHDDGVYALLAKAIATGRGFHYIGLPGAPAATHYPPLYPLLLAAVWRVAPSFPENLGAMLGLNALLVGIAAFGLARFADARMGWRSERAAGLALVATAASPVLMLSGALLSEPLFLAALWPVLIVAERAVEKPDRRTVVAAGAAIGVLMLVRMHAAALAVALVLLLLARRRPHHALAAAAATAVTVLPWQLWTMAATPVVAAPLQGSYGSYAGWFVSGLRDGGSAFALATVRANLTESWLLLQDRVLPGTIAPLRVPAVLLLASLMLIGGLAAWRRAPTTVLFLSLYLAIVLVWPYVPWRFVWAVWPLLVLLAAEGARALWRSSRTIPARMATVFAVAIPGLAMVRTEASAYADRSWATPARRAGAQIAPAVAWVGRNTQPGDVVLAEGEQVISLFTGRRAAPAMPFTAAEYLAARNRTENEAALRDMLDQVPARYVVALAPSTQAAARALAATDPAPRAPARLALTAELPAVAIFTVLPR